MATPENKNSPDQIRVESAKLSKADKAAVFGYNAEEMSDRVIIYYGEEGEALASFHAAKLNEFIPLFEGIQGEIEVFDYPDDKISGEKRLAMGFKAVYTKIDNTIVLANSELEKLAIQKIPKLPPLPPLPDWLR